MATNYTRRISLYINGQEIENSLKSINKELAITGRQFRSMTSADKDYDQTASKIRALRDAQKEHNDQLKQSSTNYAGLQKAAGIAVAAAGAVMAVGAAIKQFFDAYREQERAVQKVEQAIASTGNAAGLSLKTLTAEASNLQNKTLFGDEEILNKSTAQLLTFTNITGDNFLKTQRAAMDLATVLDGDLQNASIMLGKAMNDPVKGITALRRVGVSFTEDQREQIKVLAETNRLEEAQGIILAEMTRQYGGQAEAAAKGTGVWSQVLAQFGEISEAIGGRMSGALIGLGTTFRDLFRSVAEGISQSSAVDEFNSQVDAVVNLTENISPLLTRYDELQAKANLSKGEQSELKNIIDSVAGAIPGAVSAFDEYGKAIGINTTKAREFINEQVAMMSVMNKKAIDEATKQMAATKSQAEQAKFELDQIMKTGTVSTTTGTVKTGLNTRTRKATQDEIREKQEAYAALAKEELGYQTLIKNLNGDALKTAVEQRAKDAQSVKETEATKSKYRKMSIASLKQLAADEDELATAELERRGKAKASGEELKDAFAVLKKEITDLDVQINNALKAGDLPLAKKFIAEKEAATQLLATYEEMKVQLAKGWDLTQGKGSIEKLTSMGAKLAKSTAKDKDGNPLKKRVTGLEAATPEDAAQAVRDNVAAEEQAAADLADQKQQALLDGAAQLNDTIFAIAQNRRQAEFDHEMSLLDKKREAELANKNLTEEQKAAINEKYDKQAAALKIKQFKKDQRASMLQAGINGIIGLGKTYAAYGFTPAGWVAAAALAASTLMQIAAIKSTPVPEFSEGGYTASSASNQTPAGVVHANEYVIPAAGVNNPTLGPLLGMLEVARQNGSLPSLDARSVMKGLGGGFSSGGFTSKNSTGSNMPGTSAYSQMDSAQNEILSKLTTMVEMLNSQLAKGLEATVAIRGRNGLYEKLEEDKQSQKNASL
jgi:hypothetical protein